MHAREQGRAPRLDLRPARRPPGRPRGVARGGRRRKKLVAWARWLVGADGQPGPGYCERWCQWRRKSAALCDACPQPALLPENVEAVRTFVRLGTQWRRGPTGRPTGLDYGAVESVLRFEAVDDQATVFRKIQTLEFAVVEAEAEREAMTRGTTWQRGS
ncbi:MAG: DUF1799 domain-containing protein [Planctomycetota bacterium]